jgi:hypothetical protein
LKASGKPLFGLSRTKPKSLQHGQFIKTLWQVVPPLFGQTAHENVLASLQRTGTGKNACQADILKQ